MSNETSPAGIDWYFDFISPFAYLQWRRLWRDHPAFARRLAPKPVLLAALLNHWGQLGPAELPGKRRHTYRLVQWQARELVIPLRAPPAHPFNPLAALRLCLAAPDRVAAVHAIFAHIWEQGLAGDSIEALAGVAHALGLADPVAAVADPAVKQQLAANGAEAIALEMFGVPTIVIDGQLFWGNDATAMALAYLGDRRLFEDPEMRRIDTLPVAATRPGVEVMTMLPPPAAKKLGLVIDLDTCVGCHACAVACKEWNAGGIAGPLTDEAPYGKEPMGVWFNRVHSYEVAAGDAQPATTLHFPRSCLHCDTPACVTVCPTGASYKRAEDGIVLVDEDKCIGCKLCSWACPYGAREYSEVEGVMKKCTLCVDRIYNEHIPEESRQPACVQACPTRARHFGDLGDPESAVSLLVAAREGRDLMPELGYRPVNKYLPPRPRRAHEGAVPADAAMPAETLDAGQLNPLLRWLDRALSR